VLFFLSFPAGNPLFGVGHSTNSGCPVLARARAGYHEPHPLPPRPPPTTCHLERSRSRICDPRSRKIRGCSCLCSCPCLCSCRCSSFCHSPQGIRFSASVIPQTPGAPFNTQPHRVLGGKPPTPTALSNHPNKPALLKRCHPDGKGPQALSSAWGW